MKQPDDYDFVKLNREHLDILVSWADQEGWNPGPHDADVFWHTDPDGFYGFFDQGELVAGGAIISYDGAFGFMGFFIVKPAYRGRGIGRKLWYLRRDTLLKRLDPGAAIGMDGVVAMQPFYNRGGFALSFRDLRYEGTGTPRPQEDAVSAIREPDLEKVLAYDRECFGCDRRRFMTRWLKMPEAYPFKYTEGSRLKGFAVLRKVRQGYKIGPLFADTPDIADALFCACSAATGNAPFYLDIPIVNTAAQALVDRHKMTYVFECARMYHGTPPALPMDKIYGITTFELG
ncbi:GNAT family N-acetyltransferase [Desulfotignum phosphitoxidans]|uniref:N-acetyltransferase, GCN5 family n=1 Tax=Desulfotignum phosphitoxidans DSM 13687 TaxID=1286635 RepID=S0FYS6_9BACT|nr:GNAT family N-acetyltransferase [Desulfotignum phosphitoxidans]EMS78344.1 N-acetyltransferase, GCN5 family [Desulfotignum phosphitoxidans DSM 13687]